MAIEAVLFDMGGVLVGVRAPIDLVGGGVDERTAWARWIASPTVRAFERGALGIDDAAAALIEEFALDATHAEVVEAVRTIPTGLLPGADVLVAEVRRLVPVGVLSNTNALHWSSQPDADAIQAMVDHAFVSFRIGLVKPDRDIFDHVASDLAVDPASVVFLDDNQVNVDGARRAGFEAHLAIGPVQARSVLIDLGLLGTGVATP